MVAPVVDRIQRARRWLPSRRGLVMLFLGAVVVDAAIIGYASFELPERVAAHFNTFGEPDRWMGRRGFLVLQVVLVALISGVFLGLSWLMAKLPPDMINVPNKAFWLAGERRNSVIAFTSEYLLLLGVATVLFFAALLLGSVQIHREPEAVRLGAWFHVPFWVYSGFLVASMVWFVTRFRVPAEEDPDVP